MGEDDLFDDALAKDNKMKEKERYVNATIADLDEDNTENSLENIKKEDNVCNDANYEKTHDKMGNKSVSDPITAHVEITNDPKDLEENKNHENKYKDRADVYHANLSHNCANIPQPSETSLEQIDDQTPTNNFVIEDEDENINTGSKIDADNEDAELESSNKHTKDNNEPEISNDPPILNFSGPMSQPAQTLKSVVSATKTKPNLSSLWGWPWNMETAKDDDIQDSANQTECEEDVSEEGFSKN